MKINIPIGNSELRFTTFPNPSKWGNRKGAFVASVQYGNRVNPDKLAEIIAANSGKNEIEARAMLNYVCSAVFDEVAKGNFVDLGILQIGLSISGVLPTANAPFDEAKNKVNVTFRASKHLSSAVRKLKPINMTVVGDEKPILYEVMADGGPKKNVILPNVRIVANIVHAEINVDAADEGIWLETLDGEKVYKAEIVKTNRVTDYFRFNGELEPGKYRLAFYSRNGNPSAGVAVVKRIVEVM